jgi:DNA-binding HxlR family transcriptional regulator
MNSINSGVKQKSLDPSCTGKHEYSFTVLLQGLKMRGEALVIWGISNCMTTLEASAPDVH